MAQNLTKAELDKLLADAEKENKKLKKEIAEMEGQETAAKGGGILNLSLDISKL